jgi:regulatory protein
MAGTITKLEVQQRNKERVSVYLDDEFAFGIDIMAAAGLRRGQQLSDAEIAQLQADDDNHRAYLSAVRLLGTRPRSRQELERRLREKQYAPEAITHALERLEREGLVDDAEFARYWSENRTVFRPRSTRALRFELRQKGVSNEDMEEALEAVDDDEAAWAAIQPKLDAWQRLPVEEFQQSVLTFLARRGFSSQTARRAWNRLQEGDAKDLPDDVDDHPGEAFAADP